MTGLQPRLPFNRKERYFTGTVLPMVVASNDFKHLGRLLDLCELDVNFMAGDPVEFLTEYGFSESVFTDQDRKNWPGTIAGDTPDVVIVGEDWFLAIEAKVFHNPNAAALNRQMARQRVLIDMWANEWALPPTHWKHVLLLPERLHKRHMSGLAAQVVVTWEQVRDAYASVAPSHWSQVLATALSRHSELESKELMFGRNAEAWFTGAQIEADGEGFLYDYVGCKRGLQGLEAMVDSGAWRNRKFEVRSTPIVAPNWFPIANFMTAVKKGPCLPVVD